MPDEAMKERAERGKKALEAQRARGEPGTKQPAHEDNRVTLEEAAKDVDAVLEKLKVDTKKSSAERSKESGNPNPTPPEERTLADTTQTLAQLNEAAGHLSAARTAMTAQGTADAALLSDPRYERDLKIQELAMTGKLAAGTPNQATIEQAEADMVKLTELEEGQIAAKEALADGTVANDKVDEKGQVRPGVSEYTNPLTETQAQKEERERIEAQTVTEPKVNYII